MRQLLFGIKLLFGKYCVAAERLEEEMKRFGLVLLVIAAVLVLYSCTMDVTVATGSGRRVVNFHLLSQRTSAQNIGLLLGVVGAVFWALGGRGGNKEAEQKLVYDKESKRLVVAPTTKKCPYCAEEVQMDAIKCKHCQSVLNS